MNRRWICSDVWMDILPLFEHAQLGLKMALLSDRFDVLVDKHFDGKSELTIWREIRIRKDIGPKPKLSVLIDGHFVEFPLPDHSLPIKIRFRFLLIEYIDHSVIEFLRSNQHIWDRSGINLKLFVCSNKKEDKQLIWNAFVPEIWPIILTRIRHWSIHNANALNDLRRLISPTILTDLDQLNSIDSFHLLPDGIADDGPNATAGQALTKWLHTPSKNGQPKRLYRNGYVGPLNLEWVNNFKETFRRATTFVSYKIQLYFCVDTMPIEPFELVNEVTNEKMTLKLSKELGYNWMYNWLLQRYPIGETATAPVKFELRYANYSCANLNNVRFNLWDGKRCIGPFSPPAEEEKEKADQSNKNVI